MVPRILTPGQCACSHCAFCETVFDQQSHYYILEHPPYSPDLAHYDFYIFPKVKSVLKGTHFESVDIVKKKTTSTLKQLTGTDFLHAFEQWEN